MDLGLFFFLKKIHIQASAGNYPFHQMGRHTSYHPPTDQKPTEHRPWRCNCISQKFSTQEKSARRMKRKRVWLHSERQLLPSFLALPTYTYPNLACPNLGLTGGLSILLSVVIASPKLMPCGCALGLASGLAYAPGMGTSSYVTSPGAAGTCSLTVGAVGGACSKPSCSKAGVA